MPVSRSDAGSRIIAAKIVAPPEGDQFIVGGGGCLILPLLPVHKARAETEAGRALVNPVLCPPGVIISLFSGPERDDIGIPFEPEGNRFIRKDLRRVEIDLDIRLGDAAAAVRAATQQHRGDNHNKESSVHYHPEFWLSKGFTLISRAGIGQQTSRRRTEE